MKKLFLPFLLLCVFMVGRFSQQEILTLPSPNSGGGIFFNVVNVLGFLRYCEKNNIDSFEVNFKDRGHYYEETLGHNWWQYFFEPIRKETFGTKVCRLLKLKKPTRVSQRQIAFFNYDGEYYLPREKAHVLINKYIRVKPEIQREIDQFKEKHFDGAYVIGIHYRGTDKHTEAALVDYAHVKESIDEAIAAHGTGPIKIFVATDTQKFVDYIRPFYTDQIITTDATRSTDGTPLHYGVQTKEELYHYRQGKETVVDALLFSHTNYLIRTSSNLSLCSSFFNPDIPVIELSKKYAMERQVN